MQAREAPDFWGLQKSKNCEFPLRNFMTFNVKEALINSYFMSDFNYCPLVWMFSIAESSNRIENLQKRALRFLPDDSESTYEQLLNKAGKMSINILRTLFV